MNRLLLLEDDLSLIDGLTYSLRKNGSRIPVIFLTASDEEVSIIRGLDCGGDDYVTKPFRLGELCSRIRALLRRAGEARQNTPAFLSSGSLTIDVLEAGVSGWKASGTDRSRIPPSLSAGTQRRPCHYERRHFERTLGRGRTFRGRQYPVRLRAPASRKGRSRSVKSCSSCHSKRFWIPVEGGTIMNFFQDRQIRRYCLFLLLFSLLLFCFGGCFCLYQTNTAKNIYLAHDQALASALLKQGVSETVVADALTSSSSTPEGTALLNKIGIGESSASWFFSLSKPFSPGQSPSLDTCFRLHDTSSFSCSLSLFLQAQTAVPGCGADRA